MNWQYNEFKQVGKDYSQKEEVDVYEKTHSQFRDILWESKELINHLNISANDTLVDFGSGTGIFAIEAAKKCKKVYAVDISPEMLAYSQQKAKKELITNIEFVRRGYLWSRTDRKALRKAPRF
ncbi:MAG: methyltransferase domain-containing protein [Cyclobacteriaceae bacterium]